MTSQMNTRQCIPARGQCNMLFPSSNTTRPLFYVRTKLCHYNVLTRNAASAPQPSAEIDPEWANARPYSEIPGPKPLPIPKFGNFWRVLPFGPLGGIKIIDIHKKLIEDYGPIVKFGGLGRHDSVMLADPEDCEKMFRTETIWPVRPAIKCIDYYRRHTRFDVYQGNPGILSSQGEIWQNNRTAVNQPMMKPKNVMQYHQPIQLVASEFINKIKTIRDDKLEMPKDFSNELNKWALESISLVALDARLGCLETNLKPDSDGQIMISSVNEMFNLFYELEFMPNLWEYFSTSRWRRFVKVMDDITNISMKHINKKKAEIDARPPGSEPGNSVLEALLNSNGKFMAVTMAMDMMLAGIDTTSNATAIALYYLAKHPEAQEKVFEEVSKLLQKKDSDLPENYLNDIPYLKACIKESQRLTPIATGNVRAAGKDLVIKDYQIPKGTELVSVNMVMSNSEDHFPRAKEFIPERWLKTEKDSELSAKSAHPFVFMPFGFGPRMCIGRRLAELEMHTTLSKICRNFRVTYNYKDMEWQSHVLLSPKDPLRFRMEERAN